MHAAQTSSPSRKPRRRRVRVAAAVLFALSSPAVAARAQDRGAFTAELRGVAAGPLAGYATFRFGAPDAIGIELMDTTRSPEIVVIRFARRGGEMPTPGTYPVGRGNVSGLPPTGTFAVGVQLPVSRDPACNIGYGADTAEGSVVIEAADSTAARGRFDVKLFRRGLPRQPAGCDTVWMAGRFRARFDDFEGRMIRMGRAARAAAAHADSASRTPGSDTARSPAQELLDFEAAASGRPHDAPRLAGGDTVTVIVGRGVVARVDTTRVQPPGAVPTRVLYLTPPPGRPLRYAFRASRGFKGLAVRGGPTRGKGGASLPESGTLAGTAGPRYLLATADVVVRLQAENRRLYQLEKAMYRARDPLPAMRQVVCERERMTKQFGDTMTARLDADVAHVLEDELPRYWEHVQRVVEAVARQPDDLECRDHGAQPSRRPARAPARHLAKP